MVVVNAIRKTEFAETSTVLSLLAATIIIKPMNRMITVVKIRPTIVARTNLKNCFIKCYKYKYLCKLSNSIPYNIKSRIYNICYNMNDVYLLLGSNLGDRQYFLQQAIQYIENEIAPVVKISSVYETQSWGKTDAPDYLNQVILVQTNIPPQTVLEKILDIEISLGRKREEKWGSRTIDIDILFYGNAEINEPDLHIPHPELHKRRFTLEPLSEIAPHFVHTKYKKSLLELKNELQDSLIVKKL